MHLTRAQKWLAATAFWTLFGAASGLQIWFSMLAHHHDPVRLVLYHVSVWTLWIPIGFLIQRLMRRAPLVPPTAPAVGLHALAFIGLAAAHALWWVTLQQLIVPYDFMNPHGFWRPLRDILICQWPLELILFVLVALASYATDTYARYREGELRAAQLERSLAEARLHSLEWQLQPHFLFNTLNAISALVRTGQPEQAVGMISGLSDLLRYALEKSGLPSVTLAEEAAVLERYLEIQRLRFADRLEFRIEIPPETRTAAVPVLLLQPLVENAVRHGVARSSGPGFVAVRAAREGESLRIEIVNRGRLVPGTGRGIGLANTVERLEQLYGARQRFELREEGDGVVARLTLPWSTAT